MVRHATATATGVGTAGFATGPAPIPQSRGPPAGIVEELALTALGSVVDATGGSTISAEGNALVGFGPGLVGGPTIVRIAPTSVPVPTTIRPLSDVFSLTATDTANGALITTFAGAPLLTIGYDANGPTPTAIYYIDPSGVAIAIASTVDRTAHTITAALPHFSDFVAAR